MAVSLTSNTHWDTQRTLLPLPFISGLEISIWLFDLSVGAPASSWNSWQKNQSAATRSLKRTNDKSVKLDSLGLEAPSSPAQCEQTTEDAGAANYGIFLLLMLHFYFRKVWSHNEAEVIWWDLTKDFNVC